MDEIIEELAIIKEALARIESKLLIQKSETVNPDGKPYPPIKIK